MWGESHMTLLMAKETPWEKQKALSVSNKFITDSEQRAFTAPNILWKRIFLIFLILILILI